MEGGSFNVEDAEETDIDGVNDIRVLEPGTESVLEGNDGGGISRDSALFGRNCKLLFEFELDKVSLNARCALEGAGNIGGVSSSSSFSVVVVGDTTLTSTPGVSSGASPEVRVSTEFDVPINQLITDVAIAKSANGRSLYKIQESMCYNKSHAPALKRLVL